MTLRVVHWPAFQQAPEHYELLQEINGHDAKGQPVVTFELRKLFFTLAEMQAYLACKYPRIVVPFGEGLPLVRSS